MKFTKKIMNIILIFVCIQLIGMFFVNNITYAESKDFLQEVSDRNKQWKQIGEGNAQGILDNATELTGAINSISNFLRIICVGLFMITIATTFIRLSSDETGKDKALAKKEIIYLVILALIFVFSKQIMQGIVWIFEQFEGIA